MKLEWEQRRLPPPQPPTPPHGAAPPPTLLPQRREGIQYACSLRRSTASSALLPMSCPISTSISTSTSNRIRPSVSKKTLYPTPPLSLASSLKQPAPHYSHHKSNTKLLRQAVTRHPPPCCRLETLHPQTVASNLLATSKSASASPFAPRINYLAPPREGATEEGSVGPRELVFRVQPHTRPCLRAPSPAEEPGYGRSSRHSTFL